MDGKKIKEWLKSDTGSLIVSICEIIIGILLFVNPEGFTNGIIIASGVIMLILGVIQLVKYFITDIETAKNERALFNGLLLLIAGGFCAFDSKWFIGIFSVISIMYGIVLVLLALNSIQATVTMLRLRDNRWYLELINALILIVFSIIIFVNPFGAGKGIWIFTGIVLIISALYDIAKTVIISRPVKNKEKKEVVEKSKEETKKETPKSEESK